MSLNIRGFRAKTADLREIQKVMRDTTIEFLKVAFSSAFQKWVEITPGVRLPSQFSLTEIYKLIEGFSEQNPVIVRELEDRGLQLYPVGEYTYGWIYGSGFESIETALLEMSLIEDFSYWNNADKPEDLTEKEWACREKVWEDLNLEDPDTMFLTAAAIGRQGAELVKYAFIELLKKAYEDNEEWINLYTESEKDASDQDPKPAWLQAVMDTERARMERKSKGDPYAPQYILLRLVDPGNKKGKVKMYECPACRKRFTKEQAMNPHTINECIFNGAEIEISFAGGRAKIKTRAEGKAVTFPEFTIIPTSQDFDHAHIEILSLPNKLRRRPRKQYFY